MHDPRPTLWLSLLCICMVSAMAQASDVSPDAQVARCEVWARETSLAQSVQRHDAAAFAAHLHPDAVFVNGDGSSHGATVIAADWAGLVAGDGLLLRWYPDAVDVGADGQLALSRGPYWMENPAATEPGKRYRRGRFISTWLRGSDGQWQVVFDGGGGDAPVPATSEEIAALAAERKPCTSD